MVTTSLLGRRVSYPYGTGGKRLKGEVVLVSAHEGGHAAYLLVAPDVGESMDLRSAEDCTLLPEEDIPSA